MLSTVYDFLRQKNRDPYKVDSDLGIDARLKSSKNVGRQIWAYFFRIHFFEVVLNVDIPILKNKIWLFCKTLNFLAVLIKIFRINIISKLNNSIGKMVVTKVTKNWLIYQKSNKLPKSP